MAPGISWENVFIQRTLDGLCPFSAELEQGRRHVFVGKSKGLSELVNWALGREKPDHGTVLIDGQQPRHPGRMRLLSFWLQALLSSGGFSWLGFALARRLRVLILREPFLKLEPKRREEALRRLLQAQEQYRFTLLMTTRSIELAVRVGETFRFFNDDGVAGPCGDLETVFRPPPDSWYASPDQPRNPVADPRPCFVDFDGVKVPVNPVRNWLESGDGGDSEGEFTSGYTVYSWSASFYVPVRCVVVSPAFVHGAPSGSPPLPPFQPEEPLDSGEDAIVEGGDPVPVPVDPVARWIVLEGRVANPRPMGPWVRIELTRGDWRFLADVPPDQVPEPGSLVRFGFDSAHVVRGERPDVEGELEDEEEEEDAERA